MAGAAGRALNPRALFTWIHRYVGLAMAGFLIIAGATGVPLAFNAELEALLSPRLFRVAPRDHPPLSPDELIARVERAMPQLRVEGLNYRPGPAESIRAYVEPRPDPATGKTTPLGYGELFIDPYDASILGMREWGAIRLDRAHLMPFLYKLHYTLHIPGQAGVILFGIIALMWMFDCFVGFYLTLPMRGKKPARQPSKRPARAGKSWWTRWKPAWLIKIGAAFTRINLDIHRAGGLWFWAVLFILALTSVSLNLSGEVMRPTVSLFSKLSDDPFAVLPDRSGGAPKLSYAEAVATAKAALPPANAGASPSYLSYLRNKRVYWVALMPDDRVSGYFQLEYAQVFLDGDDGSIRYLKTYAGGSAGDKFLDWQLPLHTGQILGLPGRIVICISGVLVVALSVTGVIIWWQKRRARTSRSRQAAWSASKSAFASFFGRRR